MNNDFEGPEKGHEILRYIDPMALCLSQMGNCYIIIRKNDLSLPIYPRFIIVLQLDGVLRYRAYWHEIVGQMHITHICDSELYFVH